MARENNSSLTCCVPVTVVKVCSLQPITRTSLLSMVKVVCTSKSCKESGFIHPECFEQLEKALVCFVNNNVHNVKKYAWRQGTVKENLWKDLIYHWIMKQVKCNCGHGYIKKDLGWPPPTIIRKKGGGKNKEKVREGPSLPQLNQQGGGKVRYIPAVIPEYPEEEIKAFNDESKTIPGAVFVENVCRKRGVVVTWCEGEGQIRNLMNKEERLCMVKEEVVEGLVDIEGMIGSEVEYLTEKRGKKLVAMSVKVVKSSDWREGIVTHWVPEELAGVIKTGKEEVLVYRKEFVPGGFAPDIVGKTVKFKLNRKIQEAISVQVVHHQKEKVRSTVVDDDDIRNQGFDSPVFALAISGDSALLRDLDKMSCEQQEELLDQLEEFMTKVASHPVGYKVVMEMVKHFYGKSLARLVKILTKDFFSISESPAGAMCMLESLKYLPRDLVMNVAQAYCSVTSCQDAMNHITGENSSIVFTFLLPFMNTSLLRHLVLLLSPGLGMLVGHKILHLLIDQVSRTDHEVLHLLASHLDAQNLLSSPLSGIMIQLVRTGDVKICGLVLHSISGKMATMLARSDGRELVAAFIWNASELQVQLVMDELCVEPSDGAPLLVVLVTCSDNEDEEDVGGEVLAAVMAKGRPKVLKRMLNIFKLYSKEVILSACGRRWISSLSKRVNSGRDH